MTQPFAPDFVCEDAAGIISRTTNADQKGTSGRLYTSTPYKNNAFGFCNLAKQAATGTSKHYNICVGGRAAGSGHSVATFDPRLKTLLLLFAILIIGFKSVILAMPYINASSVHQLTSYVQSQLSAALEWSQDNQIPSKISPVVCGLIVAIVSYALVYLDSAVPGVSPPTPFSPRSKQRFRQQRNSSLHLNYICALGAGLVVGFLMYVDL
ncbi:ADP-ribosylation factor-like protein 6-interacting protein 6 [Scaptodrosophila lebanonensis]|uniref:ADP-ribosylation factor-like protein 6-interacting protein 6 n=1 Tax=Drosophila lebanonensis TaxID=7225 RepID=A0A6J2UFY5_DROLE|nr:ADP-ribosylation factor-like protein 6-interacting protein 6 [Scaptodrosophila lebanonensis]